MLSRSEVDALLDRLDADARQEPYALMARLMYGAGLRLMECCRLRVKDMDLNALPRLARDPTPSGLWIGLWDAAFPGVERGAFYPRTAPTPGFEISPLRGECSPARSSPRRGGITEPGVERGAFYPRTAPTPGFEIPPLRGECGSARDRVTTAFPEIPKERFDFSLAVGKSCTEAIVN